MTRTHDRQSEPQPKSAARRHRLHHGYTNESWREGDLVYKRYVGERAAERLETEVATIKRVAGAVPTARVVEVEQESLLVVFAFVPGRQGQDRIASGHGSSVLRSAGVVLRQLQETNPHLVHGDYGPQNLLYDSTDGVVAIVDWELAHEGDPIEDLVWAEWIVRMHHPGAVACLHALFDGYGHTPAWGERRGLMLHRCEAHREMALSSGNPSLSSLWLERTKLTRSWLE